MTDVSAAIGDGHDAAAQVVESPPPPDRAKLAGDVHGFQTQLAEQDDIIARSQAAVDEAHAHAAAAEAAVVLHQTERADLETKLAAAEAALAAHEGN